MESYDRVAKVSVITMMFIPHPVLCTLCTNGVSRWYCSYINEVSSTSLSRSSPKVVAPKKIKLAQALAESAEKQGTLDLKLADLKVVEDELNDLNTKVTDIYHSDATMDPPCSAVQ